MKLPTQTMPAVIDGQDGSDGSDAGRLHEICELLAWQFGVARETIDARTVLVDQLYADSMDLLETAHVLNQRFAIEIGAEQLAQMHTVGDVGRVVAAMTRAAA